MILQCFYYFTFLILLGAEEYIMTFFNMLMSPPRTCGELLNHIRQAEQCVTTFVTVAGSVDFSTVSEWAATDAVK